MKPILRSSLHSLPYALARPLSPSPSRGRSRATRCASSRRKAWRRKRFVQPSKGPHLVELAAVRVSGPLRAEIEQAMTDAIVIESVSFTGECV
jgi:hypothetical protein